MLSGRGLCDGLITRTEESYRLWCVVVCDLKNKEAIARHWAARAIGKNAHKGLIILKLINKCTKRKTVMILVRPTLTYVCDTWTLSVGDINNVLELGREIVRKIFGSIKCEEEWSISYKGIVEVDKRRRY